MLSLTVNENTEVWRMYGLKRERETERERQRERQREREEVTG
jgi:hypothetical protein